MRPHAVIMLLLCLTARVLADSATQTEWSGERGVWGPVTSWDQDFWHCFGVLTTSGDVRLGRRGAAVTTRSLDGVVSADMDGDGDLDLAGFDFHTGYIWWYENLDGLGSSWSEWTVDQGQQNVHCLHPGDLDGDGDTDLAGVSQIPGNLLAWYNRDGAGRDWESDTLLSGLDIPGSVSGADLDRDGDTDLVVTIYGAHEIAWLENPGAAGAWTRHTVVTGFEHASAAALADFDGDGWTDIAGAGDGEEMLVWWRNPGSSGEPWDPTEIPSDQYHTGHREVVACDLEPDGDMDLFSVARNEQPYFEVFAWMNTDGAGKAWEYEYIAWTGEYSARICPADFDGDGDQDLALGGYDLDDLAIIENPGGSGEWEANTVSDSTWAYFVVCDDIDGSGDPDLVAGRQAQVRWWDGWEHCSGSGFVESSVLYIGGDGDWGSVDWTCIEPAGTSVAFQVRASEDPFDMGPWSDTLTTSPWDLAGILEEYDSHLQYRAILSTHEGNVTPWLQEVTFTWDPLGAGEVHATGFSARLSANPSPSPVLLLDLPEPSAVDLVVYDMAGRAALRQDEVCLEAGEHARELGIEEPGVYICRVTVGGETLTLRTILVR